MGALTRKFDGSFSADFNFFNYTPVTDRYPAQTPRSYIVNNSSEDLQSIALAVYV